MFDQLIIIEIVWETFTTEQLKLLKKNNIFNFLVKVFTDLCNKNIESK